MIRVSTSSSYDILRERLAESQKAYQDKQLQVSTGKIYLNRSEDPSTGAEVALIERQKEDNEQYQENVRDATSWVTTTQSKNQEIVELLQHASELMTSANNGTYDDEHREDIAEELDILIERVFTVSESKFGSFFLFSGTKSDTPPYTETRDAAGRISGVTSNLDVGVTEQRQTQISDTTVIEYGEMADGTDGLFQSGTVDLFQNLINMRDSLILGDIPADTDMSDLEENLDHSIGHLTQSGVQQQWLMSQAKSLRNSETVQVQQLENLQAADLAAAMTDLSQLQTTLQATMQMVSRVNQLSIMNYI
jgi:flagellar hook-associated protein 3 FlgL